MIDAEARSLQLPVLLAAQISINTLFFRASPLRGVGRVICAPLQFKVGQMKLKTEEMFHLTFVRHALSAA